MLKFIYPELTKRIYNEGYEVGSHTFTHTDIMSISDKKLEIELSSTQRVIQGITGYSVIMFRPPFLSINEGSNELPTKETFDKILKIQDLGYTVVGSSIDPQDWNGKSAEEIFKETTKNIRNSQIILLHDSGGDRTPTIEALPKIIEWLKANGYSIVPVSELVGMERSAVMPLVQETEESIMLCIYMVHPSMQHLSKQLRFSYPY